MSAGQTGQMTGQMGHVHGTDGTQTRGVPAKILYVYWFFSFPRKNPPFGNPPFGNLEETVEALQDQTVTWKLRRADTQTPTR